MASLHERQLALLGSMASLDPPPCFIGGYAEDALLAGSVTRPHLDVDWLVPRRHHALRLAQAVELGFGEFEVPGEANFGEPSYVCGQNGDLKLDLSIADEEGDKLWISVLKRTGEPGGKEALASYCFQLPRDTFSHPEAQIEGIIIRPASPLALYQIRVGVAGQGSFGELSGRQLESARRLKERFFPNRSHYELEPRIKRRSR